MYIYCVFYMYAYIISYYVISYYIISYCIISYYNSNYIIYIYTLCLYMYGLHVSFIWCCIWIICRLHAGWNVVRIKRIKVVTHVLAGIHPPKYIHFPSRMKPGHWGMISGDLIWESLCHVSDLPSRHVSDVSQLRHPNNGWMHDLALP